MRALAVTGVSLRRVLRDRRSLLITLVLPILLILVVGGSIGGTARFKVGLVDVGAGPLGARVAAAMSRASDITLTRYGSLGAARLGLSRSEVQAVVALPSGLSTRVAGGGRVLVDVLSEQSTSTQRAAAAAATSVLERVAVQLQAAQFAAAVQHAPYATALAIAGHLAATVKVVAVDTHVVQHVASSLPLGFGDSAPTMLVLFVFISAMSGGAMLIEVRSLGLYTRMLAAPIEARSVVAGEFLALLVVAVGQSALIVAVGSAAFGVSWGDPLAAIALIAVWAVVAAGAGMLGATLFATPEQATALGPTLGIVLGMLGGCMWPLSIVSAPFRMFGHLAPQAWAVDAWTGMLARHDSLVRIAPQLAVLAGVATVLLVVATRRLRHTIA